MTKMATFGRWALRRRRFRLTSSWVVVWVTLGAPWVSLAPAQADSLDSNSATASVGGTYVAFEELSHEVIVHASEGLDAELEVRVALRNAGTRTFDGLLRLALPRHAILSTVSAAHAGVWLQGRPTALASSAGTDDQASGLQVAARQIDATAEVPFPIGEVVVRRLPAGEIVQVSLRLRVFAQLHLDRWQVVLPSREVRVPHLQAQRRIVVKSPRSHEPFWLDDQRQTGVVESPANNPVSIAWPAHVRRQGLGLSGQAEIIERLGQAATLRLSLRLGQSKRYAPDHVAVLIDHSRSTSPTLAQDALRVVARLVEQLPATTFDVIAFARVPLPLLDRQDKSEPHFIRQGAESASDLARAQNHWPARASGSDLARALRLALARGVTRRAKKPAVLVLTDAMLARQAAREWKARQEPPIYVVVDDPYVALLGFDVHQPTLGLAGRIGARVSIESLADLATKEDIVARIFASPPVLHDLKVEGVPPASLAALPDGMVGGQVIHVTGTALPRQSLRIRGRLAHRPIRTPNLVARRTRQAAAFVVAFAGSDTLPAYALPSWVLRSLIHQSDLTLSRAASRGRVAMGTLDEGIFLQHLRAQVLPRARACYNQALARQVALAGTVHLHFEVGVGEVAYARVGETSLNAADPHFVACLQQAAWALDMPAAALDIGVYEVDYPLTFVAPLGKKPSETRIDLQPLFEQIMAGPHPDAPVTRAHVGTP